MTTFKKGDKVKVVAPDSYFKSSYNKEYCYWEAQIKKLLYKECTIIGISNDYTGQVKLQHNNCTYTVPSDIIFPFEESIQMSQDKNDWVLYNGTVCARLRETTLQGNYILEDCVGNITKLSKELVPKLKLLPNNAGFNWKPEKTLKVGCKTLVAKNNMIYDSNDNIICSIDFLNKTLCDIDCISRILGVSAVQIMVKDKGNHNYCVEFEALNALVNKD